MKTLQRIGQWSCASRGWTFLGTLLIAGSLFTAPAGADEPYARSKDYDLQHSKIVLAFDVEHKKVIGEVTHTLSVLKDGTNRLAFDSVGLTIQSVTVNKATSKFTVSATELTVPLASAAKKGDRFEVQIKYEGKTSKGAYFILPDKDYPDRPKQIWTQGESEDTRYYLPTYDYPNARLTTETILTVPAAWVTIANGKLVSVKEAGNGMKTWSWQETGERSEFNLSDHRGGRRI